MCRSHELRVVSSKWAAGIRELSVYPELCGTLEDWRNVRRITLRFKQAVEVP